MITAGDDSDHIIPDLINESMLLVDPSRPTAGQLMLEWFGLAFAGERITPHILDEFENTDRLLAVALNPPCQVIKGR